MAGSRTIIQERAAESYWKNHRSAAFRLVTWALPGPASWVECNSARVAFMHATADRSKRLVVIIDPDFGDKTRHLSATIGFITPITGMSKFDIKGEVDGKAET